MRRPAIPVVLLVLLLLAYFTRWHTVATKTVDNAAYKWAEDRWTGQVWVRAYRTRADFFERPDPRAVDELGLRSIRNTLSWTWDGVAAATLAWLFWSLWASGSRGRNSS